MKTKKLLFLLFVVMLTSASGCHGTLVPDSNDTTTKLDSSCNYASYQVPSSFDSSKEINLSFWSKNDTNFIQKNIYQDAIDQFEALYPNVHINLISKTNYEDIYADVLKNIPTKTTPNICITYPDHVATYLTGEDMIVPLDDLMSDSKFGLGGSELRFDGPNSDELITKFVDECKYRGKQAAMPYMRSTEACYINKTYVESLGFEVPDILTWDYIWEVCEAAAIAHTDDSTLFPFIYKSVDNQMITMLKQKGAEYTTEDGDVLLFNDTTRGIMKELATYTEKNMFEIFAVVSYPANYLNAGEAIFTIDSTAGATWMGSKAPLTEIDESQIIDFETVVRPVPQYDENNPIMISQGPSVCVFNKTDDQEVLASWLFVQYLLSNNIQIPYSETEGYIPVTKKAIESEDYKAYLKNKGATNFDGWNESYISASKYYKSTNNKSYSAQSLFYQTKIDAAELTIANIDNTFITPVFNGSASVRTAAGKLIEMSVKGVNKGEQIGNAYVESIFKSTSKMYKLQYNNDTDLGPLPSEAIVVIVLLVIAWICIGSYFTYIKVKEKKKKAKR